MFSYTGKRTEPRRGTMGIVRVSFDIGSEIDHGDRVGDCPNFDNQNYNIMTPMRVYTHLRGKRDESEIEKRIRGVIQNQKQAKALISRFQNDLREIENVPFLTHGNCEFELLIIGMDKENYRYTPGYESQIEVHNLENHEGKVLIRVSPIDPTTDACLPLMVQRIVDLDNCQVVEGLTKHNERLAYIEKVLKISPSE